MTGWRTHQQRLLDDAADARARRIAREEIVRAVGILKEHLNHVAGPLPYRVNMVIDEAIDKIKEGDPE